MSKFTICVTDTYREAFGAGKFPSAIKEEVMSICKLAAEKNEDFSCNVVDAVSLLAFETYCLKYGIQLVVRFNKRNISKNIEKAFAFFVKPYAELIELREDLRWKEAEKGEEVTP